jgi:hypothetical protein
MEMKMGCWGYICLIEAEGAPRRFGDIVDVELRPTPTHLTITQ